MTKSPVEPGSSRKGMSWVPGGTFLMGSEDSYPEERPVRRVAVDGFWMDEHPVTNAEFRRFVKATGYTTVAEARACKGGGYAVLGFKNQGQCIRAVNQAC